MTWPIAMLFAALLGIFAAEVEARAGTVPGLVIECADGAVLQLGMGEIASGRDCVLHDKAGRALSVAMLSAYNDELAAP